MPSSFRMYRIVHLPPRHSLGRSLRRLAPAFEPAEPPLLLRVHQVDCPHGQLGEATSSPDRTPQRARVTHIHVPISYTLPERFRVLRLRDVVASGTRAGTTEFTLCECPE